MKTLHRIILSTLAISILAVSIAQAGYTPISRNACALSVHPYNASASGGDLLSETDASWFNIFKGGTSQCDNHAIYPNAYTPQPPSKADAPLKSIAGIADKSAPGTIHIHKYFDDSTQDSYYYKSFTDSFQIILESDALANTDLSQLVCYSPGEGGTVRTTPGCKGTLSDWGGTEITFDSGTGIINWKFATGGTGRPRLYGIDPGLSGRPNVPDTSNEEFRKLEFGVKLVSKNVGTDIWSATTTSRTLVRDQAILTGSSLLDPGVDPDSIGACSNDGKFSSSYDYNSWCTLPDSSIGSSTKIEQKDVSSYSVNGKTYNITKNYYWKQIGVVSTVWQKPVAAPSDVACADLQWGGAFLKKAGGGAYSPDLVHPNALLENEAAIMKFKTLYDAGAGTKRPLEYRWVSFNGETNRPPWFKNDDSLFGGFKIIPLGASLPGRLLMVAHAALPPLGAGAASAITPIGSAISSIINIGKFKDEITDVLSGNPIVDTDNQAWYSGGSEGVTLGVQAFYTDTKNIPGQGDLVKTEGGWQQKASKCHLELNIQPPPAICVGLTIDPSSLAAKTPVTFTVTPKFSPAGSSIPLNYYWEAKGGGPTAYNRPAGSSGLNARDYGTADIFGTDIAKAALPPVGGASKAIIPSFILPGPSGKDIVDKDLGTAQEVAYGAFKDYLGGPDFPNNPFLEQTDNKTYYTGGPVGTIITVQGQSGGKILPGCSAELTIPPLPPGAKCKILKVKFFDGATEVPIDKLVAGKTYRIEIDKANSKKTDDTLISNFDILLNNPTTGVYGTLIPTPGNPAGCSKVTGAAGTIGTDSTSVDCKYNYTPNAGDKIKVEADPTDGVAACTVEQIIPGAPSAPICKSLNLSTSPLIVGSEIAQGQKVAFTSDPRDTDSNSRNPVVYSETGTGNFVADPANAGSCTAVPASSSAIITFEAPNTCKYSYQASSDSTSATVSIKVKQDDGVADCTKNFVIPSTPTPEQCLALNLQVNGAFTLNPLLTPGTSYALQASPITTKGNPIISLAWTESGAGELVGQPSNPGICPAIIDNGTVVTPSFCRYIYAGGVSASDGFSVKAVPDDGNPNCQAASSSFTPPVVKPFCLYLDLSHNNPDTYDGVSSDLTAVVVMSDGSKYNDHVRFISSDGSGAFTGGLSPLDSGSSNFRSSTDATNSTQKVYFSSGSGSTNLNIFLADTTVMQSAACQRQLAPIKKPDNKCNVPPTITHVGTTYSARTLGGDSVQYCWTISGPLNPLGNPPTFTNGHTTTTGDTVLLSEDYKSFSLHVEDCNPSFKSICSDDFTKENTPKITKSIAKLGGSFGTKINYSTKKTADTEQISYKLAFTPSNYSNGNNMTAVVYDPAFTGTINGHKPFTDKLGNVYKQKGGDIAVNLSSIIVKDNTKTYLPCAGTGDTVESCYETSKSSKYPGSGFGSLTIHGIQSNSTIYITYDATLHSSITIDDCKTGDACNEQFINQSLVSDMQFCSSTTSGGKTTVSCTPSEKLVAPQCQDVSYYDISGISQKVKPCDLMTITSNITTAELVCQYFLTRASGDVFLEDTLKYGIDVSKCYPFKNVSSTIVTPVTPIPGHLISTGTPEVVSISHEICSAGQSNFTGLKNPDGTPLSTDKITALTKLFGANLTTLSSQICEIGLVPGSDWDKATISAAIDQNIGKLTRWASGINPSNEITDFQTLDGQSLGKVYYYDGNLGGSKTVTIESLSIPEGSGPYTIIVENADLQINGDIKYSVGATVTDPKMISSLGVIVLDGNMYVDPKVVTLSGAYFVQRSTAADLTKGNIISGNFASPNQNSDHGLTVYGSMYGNIGPLFQNRTAAGDITQDQGAVTIRYDQRIIQNPPQGLAELLGSFSQSQVAQ